VKAEESMRILFVADGRSQIALNWITHFVEQEHEVHLVSTYPCAPELKLASLTVVPVALSQAAGLGSGSGGEFSRSGLRRLLPVSWRTRLRQWSGPLTLPGAARGLKEVAEQVKPELVHAMRIPYEGMLAALADPPAPLLISIWGNDFTLHANATSQMKRLTRQALGRADALHADCRRDIRLAQERGYPAERPYRVLPGGGGIQLDLFSLPSNEQERKPLVINPRGFRAYVRNDVFFQSIPIVLANRPEARFLCPNMAGEAQAQTWVKELGIGEQVELLPTQTRPQMAGLFQRSQVVVSPTTHDGTPNTLLEGMACGCFPVAGDLESIREWITPGENGLLVDPSNPQAMAVAILVALSEPRIRAQAAVYNRRLVEERAEYGRVMQSAETFYQEIIYEWRGLQRREQLP
jgi:glycosyltransferase involved in cell wall biosynthesis